MSLKEMFQGKWLGHPVHGVLVHIPVGLWPAAFVFDLLSRQGDGNNALVQLSFFAIGLGVAAAVAAVLPGLADWSSVKRENPAWRLGLFHLLLNAGGLALWLVNFTLRAGSFQTALAVPPGLVVLSGVGVALLLVSVYLGGRMVYAYGISVARFSKDRWREVARTGGANLPGD